MWARSAPCGLARRSPRGRLCTAEGKTTAFVMEKEGLRNGKRTQSFWSDVRREWEWGVAKMAHRCDAALSCRPWRPARVHRCGRPHAGVAGSAGGCCGRCMQGLRAAHAGAAGFACKGGWLCVRRCVSERARRAFLCCRCDGLRSASVSCKITENQRREQSSGFLLRRLRRKKMRFVKEIQ